MSSFFTGKSVKNAVGNRYAEVIAIQSRTVAVREDWLSSGVEIKLRNSS